MGATIRGGGGGDTSGLVTLATDQVITGKKDFDNTTDLNTAAIRVGSSDGATNHALEIYNGIGSIFIDAGPAASGSVWNFPTASGTSSFVGTVSTQTLSNKALAMGALAGTSYLRDASNGSKRLYVIMTGLTANNHSLTFNATATRDWRLDDMSGSVVIVGNGADPPGADAAAKVNRTGLTANQGSSGSPINLTNSTPAGSHTILVYMVCTSGSGGASPVVLNATWTDDSGAVTRPISSLAMTTTGGIGTAGHQPVYLSSGNITWFTSGYSAGTYAIRMRVSFNGA